MVESSYTTTPQLSRFENLPPELTNTIIDLLPPESLASVRLCWPHLNGVIVSRLFKAIRVTFAERDIERLQAVSSTYPYYVQELVFTTAQSRNTHSDRWGQVFTGGKYQKYIKDYRRRFLTCLDALPNLHTFTSELDPISGTATEEHIDGLVYAIFPALCHSSSRITTLRCQDPMNYMRWFLSQVRATRGPPEGMIKVIPRICTGDICTCWQSCPQLSRLSSCTAPPSGRETDWIYPRTPWEWRTALRGLTTLDLQNDTAGGSWNCFEQLGDRLVYFLEGAVNLQELSVRWRRTDQIGSAGRPLIHSGWQLEHIFRGRWKSLKTIKLTFIQFTFSANPFKTFIRRHSSTLRHIMLHNCRSDPEVIRIIKFAASCPGVHLHRFAVFPAYESHPRVELLDESYSEGKQVVVEKPRIVPESAVLGFINSKDPQHLDPFTVWKPLEYEYWGTVEQKAESTSIKWPQNNGMAVKCKLCSD
ncbi:hypothetical protein FPANT_1471 [Fusarium pseudoanthophilum]|uniref:F-box domain-containing protein n=1 Tax=Fusarium pseudoanthophilum TaxID=48495 RepID=A0A8H5PWQ3_9HYPO|nr:hypothetical protein FPANT_1471 [Fusarium pseudoanthophilum]